MVVLLKDKLLVKIVKLQMIDKLFMDLIFAYFMMLEALFNFPRWMHLFGFLSVSESEGILIYLDLIQPGGEVKTTLCSGFNELGLWATLILPGSRCSTLVLIVVSIAP